MKKIVLSLFLIFGVLFGKNVFAFNEVKMTDNEIISKFNLEKRIVYNWRWGDMKTFLTKKGNEVVYYNGKISKEYKKIDDGRDLYHYDGIVWDGGDIIKEDIFSRISKNKDVLIFKAEKLNGNFVIVKNFIEGPEFSNLREYFFSSDNNNIIYSVLSNNSEEIIYLNEKFIYKRQFKKLLDNELKVSNNGKYIIGDRNPEGQVIFNFNGEIINTDYFKIDEIFLSNDGTVYGGKVADKKNGKYNKLIKNGVEILDISNYVIENEYGDINDNFYVQFISKDNKIISYYFPGSTNNSIFVDNKDFLLKENTFFSIFNTNSNIIDFGNGLLGGILNYNDHDNIFYILDCNNGNIRYSKNYEYFHNIKYEDGYITFGGKLKDGTYVFVHNLKEYKLSFSKSGFIRGIIINKKNLKNKKNGDKLIKKIDLLVGEMDENKLEKFYNLIEGLELYNYKTRKYNPKYFKYKDMLYYLQNRIGLKLFYNYK